MPLPCRVAPPHLTVGAVASEQPALRYHLGAHDQRVNDFGLVAIAEGPDVVEAPERQGDEYCMT